MTRLIGISGKIGSGKDTVGNIIQSYTEGFEIKKFATKLKILVADLLNCSLDDLENQDFKNKQLGPEYWYWEMQTGSKIAYLTNEDFYKIDLPVKLIKPTVRTLMQRMATEAIRNNVHPDIWVNALFADYTQNSKWIITDLRFLNEMNRIKALGGITIRVNRKLDTLLYHSSETELDNEDFDYYIDNNDSIDQLKEQVRKILNEG